MSLLDTFEKVCPIYMVYGMTYHQFWDGDVFAHKAYKKAYELRQEDRNANYWLQGRYVYDAIVAVAPVLRAFSKAKKPAEYNEKPYDITASQRKRTEEEEERKRYERIKERVQLFADEYNKRRKEAVENGRDCDQRD